MPAWLRWLSVVPAAAGGWYASLVGGLGARSVLMRLCPPDDLVSGLCMASWYRPAEDALICVFAGIAASLVIVLATLVAPSRKIIVGLTALLLGSLAAVVMGIQASAYAPALCAIIAGTLTAYFLRRRYLVPPDRTREQS